MCRYFQEFNITQNQTLEANGLTGCDATVQNNFEVVRIIPNNSGNLFNFTIFIGTSQFLITGQEVNGYECPICNTPVKTSTFNTIEPINNGNAAKDLNGPYDSFDFNRNRYRYIKVKFEMYIIKNNTTIIYTFQEVAINVFVLYVSITLNGTPIFGSDPVNSLESINPRRSIILNEKLEFSPQLLIRSQTLIDLSDIGNTIFEIIDIYQYYCDKPLFKGEITITKFEKSCPKIVSVLDGKGKTALDKINYLYVKYNLEGGSLLLQYNLIKYSMVRYFLSRLLYGNWDINYLLNKYYDKFLYDLSKSRFNNFVEFFTNPNSDLYNYNKYFLWSDK